MPHFQNESSYDSNKNKFDLHENGRTGETHFHMNGFARSGHKLETQRPKVTRKWPIMIQCGFSIYGLLTKCEVKMAGYWPSSFFACLWTETKSRSINTQKKNEANILPS